MMDVKISKGKYLRGLLDRENVSMLDEITLKTVYKDGDIDW